VDSGGKYVQKWVEFEGHELIDELRWKQAQVTMNLCMIYVSEYSLITDRRSKQKGVESFIQGVLKKTAYWI
jgi:hypothetical protein